MAFGGLASMTGAGGIASPNIVSATRIPAAGGAGILASPYLLPAILAGSFLAPKAVDFLGLGSKNTWQTETKRLEELASKGIRIPQQLGATLPQGKGRSTDELLEIENAKAAQGMYSNPTFAKSRKVSDLKAEDIWGYSAFFDKFGNDWLEKFTEQQRRDIAQAALNAGAVNEHHGTIDVDFSKIGNLDALISGKESLNTPAQPGVNVQPGTASATQSTDLAAERQKTVDAINATFKSAAAQQQAIQDRGAKLAASMKAREIASNMLVQNQQKIGNIQYPTPQPQPMPQTVTAPSQYGPNSFVTGDTQVEKQPTSSFGGQRFSVKDNQNFDAVLNRILGG